MEPSSLTLNRNHQDRRVRCDTCGRARQEPSPAVEDEAIALKRTQCSSHRCTAGAVAALKVGHRRQRVQVKEAAVTQIAFYRIADAAPPRCDRFGHVARRQTCKYPPLALDGQRAL